MRTRLRFFIAASLCSLAFASVQAQEVKGGATTTGAPMSPSLVPVTHTTEPPGPTATEEASSSPPAWPAYRLVQIFEPVDAA